jgi:5-methyltetrahydrofolate--homocysteine methyltransferase
MATYEVLREAVINGDSDRVKEEVSAFIDKKVNALEIVSEGLSAAMETVGQRMESGDMFIPEVLMSADAMRGGLQLLKPLLGSGDLSSMSKGKIVIGTVQGDVHYLGKNLVGMMMECAGFTVIDVGENVPADKFIDAVKREKPAILGMSSLMTTTMMNMKHVISALELNGLRQHVKVIIGGAPITPSFADSIGADGFASNAGAAVEIARRLLAADATVRLR